MVDYACLLFPLASVGVECRMADPKHFADLVACPRLVFAEFTRRCGLLFVELVARIFPIPIIRWDILANWHLPKEHLSLRLLCPHTRGN